MKKIFQTVFVLSILCQGYAQASSFDDIGYTRLKTELGADLPDGAGVKVTQVEAATALAWSPDLDHRQLVGKKINVLTPKSKGVSRHVHAVGLFFYGRKSSSSPGILNIDVFETIHWMGAGFLNAGKGMPKSSSSRVANHSWISDTGAFNTDILRRVDFIVEVDEFIQAVAMNASKDKPHLLSDSFNAIVVSRSIGGGGGTTPLSDIYTGGRARPDIVAPENTLSGTTPRIASAAALLVGYGHDNPALSTDPLVQSRTTTNNGTVFNAERAETIKAILMAGADRQTSGNTWPPATPVDITDYRSAGHQTTNGLDTRFGAGQINIYNSYHILAAGEQNSEQDRLATSGLIAPQGFDYDPAFGGKNGSNATANYNFSTNKKSGQKLKASLVWNIQASLNPPVLHNLNLQLIDVTGDNTIVASSNSAIDNTENIYFGLLSNRKYQLRVIRGSDEAFNWDYALAWQVVVPESLR